MDKHNVQRDLVVGTFGPDVWSDAFHQANVKFAVGTGAVIPGPRRSSASDQPSYIFPSGHGVSKGRYVLTCGKEWVWLWSAVVPVWTNCGEKRVVSSHLGAFCEWLAYMQGAVGSRRSEAASLLSSTRKMNLISPDNEKVPKSMKILAISVEDGVWRATLSYPIEFRVKLNCITCPSTLYRWIGTCNGMKWLMDWQVVVKKDDTPQISAL